MTDSHVAAMYERTPAPGRTLSSTTSAVYALHTCCGMQRTAYISFKYNSLLALFSKRYNYWIVLTTPFRFRSDLSLRRMPAPFSQDGNLFPRLLSFLQSCFWEVLSHCLLVLSSPLLAPCSPKLYMCPPAPVFLLCTAPAIM
jgi:hypothetical protein